MGEKYTEGQSSFKAFNFVYFEYQRSSIVLVVKLKWFSMLYACKFTHCVIIVQTKPRWPTWAKQSDHKSDHHLTKRKNNTFTLQIRFYLRLLNFKNKLTNGRFSLRS